MDILSTTLLVEVAIVAVLVVLVVGGGIYVALGRRREGSPAQGPPVEPGGERGPGDGSERREFYKSVGLTENWDMKIRLYSLEEYGEHLGGDADAAKRERFFAALKAYRPIDDEWYELPPNRAAGLLDMAPEDYEADGPRGALLLRKLPPGVPLSVRDYL